MGFGMLLLGYLFAIDVITCYLLFPAGALMFCALSKLSFVNRGFARAKYWLLPLMGVGIISIVLLCISMTESKWNQLAFFSTARVTVSPLMFHSLT